MTNVIFCEEKNQSDVICLFFLQVDFAKSEGHLFV